MYKNLPDTGYVNDFSSDLNHFKFEIPPSIKASRNDKKIS